MAEKELLQNEYQQYRRDEDVPKTYVDGFGWKAVIGGLFVGFLLVPGGMFLNLMVGGAGYGDAVNWVTIILFTEIAKRCRTSLSKQETYILFAVSGGVLGMAIGSYFNSFIWNQYLVQSAFAAKFDIAHRIPIWVAPGPGSEAYTQRSLLHSDWWPNLLMMGIWLVWGRLNFYSLGYALFRITSDVERLPFPMAPIAAGGITALAESDKETWRWRVFTIGSTIGIAFSAIYVAVPTLTGVAFGQSIQLIPIPFIDLTTNFQDILPAVPLALGTNLIIIFVGFVLPFWMVVGGAIGGFLGQLIINPILYHNGVLKHWTRGSTVIETGIANGTDFWMSWGIGSGIAVALIGIFTAVRGIIRSSGTKKGGLAPPEGRGDIPITMALLFYVVSTTGTIMICHALVPKFPIWILLVFGFGYTPLMSYISARMIGLTGSGVGFPYVQEATFVLSGYKGVDIWWAPIPLGDAGGGAASFREMELTGTKFSSLFKAQLFMIPVALVSSLLFWSFIWKMGQIPSAAYPYANQFWRQGAFWQCFWRTATTTGSDFFLETIKPWFVLAGGGFALITYTVLSLFGLPTLLLYGIINGLGGDPMNAIPMLGAALVGRYYFARKFGAENWKKYTPILLAGFACGYGLIGMVSIAVSLISKAVTQMPF
ncbi:MAG TPA: peptide transporter [Planctomycetota bacterium]|nr:peptide transporter [Planctomycetota bacterium]